MSGPRSTRLATDPLQRMIAVALALMVFALPLLAASPSAHECLHADDEAGSEDRCAVVLFADGVSAPNDLPQVRPPITFVSVVSPATAAELDLVSPRYLRRPERGPPAV